MKRTVGTGKQRRKTDIRGVSEAVGTVLLLAISVTLAGGIALWTSSIEEGEEGLYVDLWASVSTDSVTIDHRGGDLLDGDRTFITIRSSDGTNTVDRLSYETLSGGDTDWFLGESLEVDVSAATQTFDLVIVTEKANGEPMVVLSNTLFKRSSSGNLPDLAITGINFQDETYENVNTQPILETGYYNIEVNVTNLGAPLTEAYFSAGPSNTVDNLKLFDLDDDLSFVKLTYLQYNADGSLKDVQDGLMGTGDFSIFIFNWTADEYTPRTLGKHTLNVKIIPNPAGEADYRNNYVNRNFNVDKELNYVDIPGPNPGIHDIYFSDSSPNSGEEVTVTVVVQNSGDEPIELSHGISLVVSTWRPLEMNSQNIAQYPEWGMDGPRTGVINWKIDQDDTLDPFNPRWVSGDWKTSAKDMPIDYDTVFPTCTIPDVVLLQGSYFYYYLSLRASSSEPGGKQTIYAAIDIYDNDAHMEGLQNSQGDEGGFLDNYQEATLQVLPRVLLVDDDGFGSGEEGDMTSVVLESLVGSGVSVDNLYTVPESVQDTSGPRDAPAYDYDKEEIAAPALKDYEIVIWVTGNDSDPFTNKVLNSSADPYEGNVQELLEFMDGGGYLLIVGTSPFDGLYNYFKSGQTTVANDAPPSGYSDSEEFLDASELLNKYLGISWIYPDQDLPPPDPVTGDPGYLLGLDTDPGVLDGHERGLTPVDPPSTDPYHLTLNEVAPDNDLMTLYQLRAGTIGTTDVFMEPVPVLTTQAENDLGSGRVTGVRAWEETQAADDREYRSVVLTFDAGKMKYLNEKIELFSEILRWFDWEINVGRDLAITSMEMSIISKDELGNVERTLIGDDVSPQYLDTLEIEILVRNNGPNIETSTVIFYVTGPDGVELMVPSGVPYPENPDVKDQNPVDISGIPKKGGEFTVLKYWIAAGIGTYKFRVVVDPYHLISEVNEENNDITYSTSTITSFVTQNNILVVDDDGSADNWDLTGSLIADPTIHYSNGEPTDAVEDMLTALGADYSVDENPYDYEVVNIVNTATDVYTISSGPTVEDLKRYNSVIWVTGDDGANIDGVRETLTSTDVVSIKAYLDGDYDEALFLPVTHKENVMFIGSNISWDLQPYAAAGSDLEYFMNEYLGIVPTQPSELTTHLVAGKRTGQYLDDYFVGTRYLEYNDIGIMPLTPYTATNAVQNDALYAASGGNYHLVGTTLLKEDQDNGLYFRTVVHSWDMDMMERISAPGETIDDYNVYEIMYLSLHYFQTPEARSELIGRDVKVTLENYNPVLGNSYIITFEMVNLGGVGGGGTVRFEDGSSLIKSDNVYLNPNQKVTIEAIWTPLYAGLRTIEITIDYYGDYDEVFEELNNEPSRQIEVYFFWDDMESGSGNWKHDSTALLINGEGRLDYMEEPTNMDAISYQWADLGSNGFYGNRDAGNPTVAAISHSSPNSFFMHEPYMNYTVRKPIDIAIIIDTSSYMAADILTANTAIINNLVTPLTENDRASLFAFDGNLEKMISGYRVMDSINKTALINDINSLVTDDARPLWDTIGTAVEYTDINRRADTTTAVVALFDGWDYYRDASNDEYIEQGSNVYAPGSTGGDEDTSTWGVSGGLYWGQTYDFSKNSGTHVQRYWSSTLNYCFLSSTLREGLLNSPVKVYNIGLNIGFHEDDPDAPTIGKNYAFTTEYDLREISSSSGGQYYHAALSSDLDGIYNTIYDEVLNDALSSTRASNDPWYDGTVDKKDKSLETSMIDLRGVDKATLSFYQKYNLRRSSNGGVVQIGTLNTDDPLNTFWEYKYVSPEHPYTGNTLISSWGTNVDDFGNEMKWCWNGISGGGSLDWEHVIFDLDEFTGQTIKVKFLYLYEYGGTGYGWFIDDVKVTVSSDTGSPATIDNWRLITATTEGESHSGSRAWFNGGFNYGDFTSSIDNSLYTRQIDLTNARTAMLEMYLKFNIDGDPGRPPDGFRVEVSTNNGVSWVPINLGIRAAWKVSGSEDDLVDGVADGKSYTGIDEGNGWVNSGSLLRLMTDLDGFIGNVIMLRIRMVTNTDGNHYYDNGTVPPYHGLYVDDVVIFGESLEGSTRGSGSHPTGTFETEVDGEAVPSLSDGGGSRIGQEGEEALAAEAASVSTLLLGFFLSIMFGALLAAIYRRR